MKRYYFISLWLIATVVSLLCTACHSNHPQIQAAYDLIERVTRDMATSSNWNLSIPKTEKMSTK